MTASQPVRERVRLLFSYELQRWRFGGGILASKLTSVVFGMEMWVHGEWGSIDGVLLVRRECT